MDAVARADATMQMIDQIDVKRIPPECRAEFIAVIQAKMHELNHTTT